jgi:hypothetical protein
LQVAKDATDLASAQIKLPYAGERAGVL